MLPVINYFRFHEKILVWSIRSKIIGTVFSNSLNSTRIIFLHYLHLWWKFIEWHWIILYAIELPYRTNQQEKDWFYQQILSMNEKEEGIGSYTKIDFINKFFDREKGVGLNTQTGLQHFLLQTEGLVSSHVIHLLSYSQF